MSQYEQVITKIEVALPQRVIPYCRTTVQCELAIIIRMSVVLADMPNCNCKIVRAHIKQQDIMYPN